MAASRIRFAAAVAVAAAAALPGCGEDDARPVGKELGGSVAPLANCGDWSGAAKARKLATIADIRRQVNRDDTGIETPPLADDEALKLFDKECAAPYARGFRLYVVYARAAGWAPLLRSDG